jgi:uncharacterized membrane protein YqaE (UPF0057 family)
MVGLMFSCSTSNDVASNRGIQKRKYNKGFYVEKGPKLGGDTKKVDQVDNENTFEENTVAIEEPQERISSTPELVYVEEAEETIADVMPVAEIDNPVEEVVETNPASNTAQQNVTVEDAEVQQSPIQKLNKRSKKFVEKRFAKRDKQQVESGTDAVLYYILAILLPPLAVGLVTNWDVLLVVVSILLTIFFFLPGIIHAIIVVSNNT